MCYYMEQIAHCHWTKLYLHSSFPFFQDYAIKAEIIWSYYHLSSEDQNKRMFSLTGKRPTMQIQAVAGKPGWIDGEVERELCTRLDVCDRKLAKLLVLLDKWKERFLILLFWLIGVVYWNHTFKYSTTTCLHNHDNVCVSGVSFYY